jgi:hypothetical protein
MKKTITTAALVLSLAACGGGGDSANSSSDTTFVTTPTAITFTATQNGPVPPSQTLHVHLNDTRLIYGSVWAGGNGPAWITEPTFAMIDYSSHPSDWDHVYQITTTNLAPGTYTATLELRTSEPSATRPLWLVEQKTVQVTYTVTGR